MEGHQRSSAHAYHFWSVPQYLEDAPENSISEGHHLLHIGGVSRNLNVSLYVT